VTERPAAIGARPARPGSGLVPLAAVVLGTAILLALGVWQVCRLQWKEALLARIAALQTAPPEPLDVVLHRLGAGDRDGTGQVDFVRVQFSCPGLEQTPTLHLYSILDGQLGTRLITACPVVDGRFRSILVDRGFVPEERLNAVRSGPVLDTPVVGVLRRPEPASWLSPPNSRIRNDWHTRDVPAMAAALNAPAPAPVFLMLERPGASAPGPQPSAIPTDIPNNHLGYALTWFGLAIGLVWTYLSYRRQRQG
jgi:surfeit locus 1 family protein